MNTIEINGIIFEAMIKNGLINLCNFENAVNDMNVFPVPDGDTGSNMRCTLEHGVNAARTDKDLCCYLKDLSSGMLLGARGNSGVILSQLFKGLYNELSGDDEIKAPGFVKALISAYQCAYKGVVHPVEGTLLTVSREGVENIKNQINRHTTFEELFSVYLAEMRKSLANTPNLLPVLREAGVLDSGAYGYILIYEGMFKYLCGEVLELNKARDGKLDQLTMTPVVNTDAFTENSTFEYGYCMEFMLQLMNSKGDVDKFDEKVFTSQMEQLGDSLVVIHDGTKVRIHIHTKTPANIITYCQQFGEFVTFKLENMQLQHNETIHGQAKKTESYKARYYPRKEKYVVAVANGDAIKELYKELGCDYIIDGGDTMNTSTQEFLDAYEVLDTDNIIVLPNNKNIVHAALQSVELYGGKKNITVIPTKNLADGYYTLMMCEHESTNVPYVIRQMKEASEYVKTISMSTAIRDCTVNGVEIKKGHKVVIADGEICAASNDFVAGIVEGVKRLMDEDRTGLYLFKNENFTDEMQEMLEDRLMDEFPELQLMFLQGNQPIYELVMALI